MQSDSPAFKGDDAKSSPDLPSSLQHRSAGASLNESVLPEDSLGPVEKLQRRYTDQLSRDIEQLEAKKTQLQADISALQADLTVLKANYTQLQTDPEAQLTKAVTNTAAQSEAIQSEAAQPKAAQSKAAQPKAAQPKAAQSKAVQPKTALSIPMPQLPGEQIVPLNSQAKASARGSIELPIPATSEQRRQRSIRTINTPPVRQGTRPRKGLVLSAIAAGLMAWHFCVVGALGQGGSWLNIPIAQLGTGFVPAVALLWLRMLVMVPALSVLAPQLYRYTWEDLQDWIYTRDRLLTLLIGSGIALFFSQVLIYQCIGLMGPAIGAMLLFLYPLTAMPLGQIALPEQKLTPLGLLAMVAIAMGGILAIRPVFAPVSSGALSNPLMSGGLSAVWLGLLASLAFSLYVVLTNLSYREQHCHPLPVAMVQFSTMAVLSSIVLLVKPLKPVAIDWLSFSLWGILLGLVMLLVYLFSYTSLRLIGARTAIVAAATPLATALLAWSFTPHPSLAIIQWTGIGLVTLGGIAFGQEKLSSAKS